MMTESARTKKAALTKILSETLWPLKFMSVTADTVTVDENGIHNIISVDRATLAHTNTRGKVGTYQKNDMLNAKYRTNEDGPEDNGVNEIEQFQYSSQ